MNYTSNSRIIGMGWKAVFIVTAGMLLFPASVVAREPASKSKWSVGTSLTYPIARIYQMHIDYRIGKSSEVFFGPGYQNFQSGSITSNAYTLIMGYRHYLWREFHVELELWPAWNRMHSSVTDTHYPGWELWAEVKTGYKFYLTRNLYVHPVPGVGFGIFRTNRPPRFSEDIDSPIFTPQIIVGWRF